ncbi:MAG: xanthine dehydrogenase family protein molybdopterin-binding subunit [Deltaproteobacteria bacterium]|nr:xanthine dehydrogenase family protein molybdopterin-binding subunit [Deltaproteobacteria bacterium]
MGEEYRYIGRIVPRRDAAAVVTGASHFLDDLRFHDLLHGKVQRSPHAHAVVAKIDTRKAAALEGVRAIVTWEDAPPWRLGNPPIRLLDQRVRYVGDAVALVAAETAELAERATKLIEVEYEELPAVFDDYEAMKPGAPQLYDALPGNLLPLGEPVLGPTCATEIVVGDCTAGFAEADAIVEGRCSYDNIPNPLPMEPPGAVVRWDGPESVTVWVSNQAVWLNKQILSSIFREKVQVRVIGGACGGSFGSKIMSWQVQCYAAALSLAAGRPVKVVFSKEEHLASFVLRPATRLEAKVGMKRDGTVTAIEGSWLLGTGYYSMTTQAQVAVGCGEAMVAVRCKNWNVKPKIVCTNRSASGIVRGFGGQELKCALFPLLSRAMERLSLDPFEVLKKNFVKPGDGYFWRDAQWYDYRGIDYSPAMDRGAAAFGWKEKWKGWLEPTSVRGAKRVGVGVGVHGNADVGEDISEAYVRLDGDGRVMVHSCLAEHGTGQRSNAVKVVAEVLRLPLESVSITPGDTLMTPVEWGPAGSRGTYAILSAVIRAAEDAKRKLFELAAPLLGAAGADELETLDGVLWVRDDPGRRLEWKRALELRTLIGHGRFASDYTLSNCMMSFVELQVDTETGKTDLLRVVNATDAGQVIDPRGLQGQMNGCLGSAGVDSALFEETIVDRPTGRILNANLLEYKWRTSAELPAIENVVLETPIDTHRFHAVGVGEVAPSPGPSAVLMAASNALGVWLESYPVTPDRVLAALHGGMTGGKASRRAEDRR